MFKGIRVIGPVCTGVQSIHGMLPKYAYRSLANIANTARRLRLAACILLILGTANASEQDQSSRNHFVTITYYGDSGFNIIPNTIHIAPGDTVTFHTDDPGTLLLRLDDGSEYLSVDGEVTFSAVDLAATKKVQCSMLLPGGLIVWEVAHEDRYGSVVFKMPGRDARGRVLIQPPDVKARSPTA